jgi:hypothetical protein
MFVRRGYQPEGNLLKDSEARSGCPKTVGYPAGGSCVGDSELKHGIKYFLVELSGNFFSTGRLGCLFGLSQRDSFVQLPLSFWKERTVRVF